MGRMWGWTEAVTNTYNTPKQEVDSRGTKGTIHLCTAQYCALTCLLEDTQFAVEELDVAWWYRLKFLGVVLLMAVILEDRCRRDAEEVIHGVNEGSHSYLIAHRTDM
jgi:hypothetical protein